MKSSDKYKLILVAALLLAIPFVAIPYQAHAWSIFGGPAALTDLIGNFIAWGVYLIVFIVTWLLNNVIALIVYFITIILQLNANVVMSNAVQSGFAVTLSVANLGFVLGIIIIAIATILHRETYGIKKTLWKLVVAAILVNFSLVIGGVIINFANQLTLTFMQALPGGGQGVAAYNNFAKSLTGAFGPHKFSLEGFLNTSNAKAETGTSALGKAIADILKPIFSALFVAAMLITTVIVLCVFLFMLLIRYIYLSILLILMPLAWLLWIFPKTSKHFEDWWDKFIKWTFFAPIVMFFVYLSVAVAGQMNTNTTNSTDPAASLQGLGYQAGTGNAIAKAISDIFGSAINTIIGSALQVILVVGLMVGGMIAAEKMSIMGAGAAIGAVKSGAKAFGTYTMKHGARGSLNLASRIMQPKPRVGPGGRLYTPLTRINRWRGQMATRLQQTATSPNLKTKGLAASVWGGVKSGSGLFKSTVNNWECQVCKYIMPSRKKPIIPCPTCHSLAATANWTQV